MMPTKENIAKLHAEKRAKSKKPKVHQKIANTFIDNAISRSNFSSLKTLYYLSTVLETTDLNNIKNEKIIGIKIDKREMLKFTELTADTIVKTVKQMQETAITFIDYDDENNQIIEGMSLLPRYRFVPNKNVIELDLYVRIAKMIVDVKKNYTPINIKDLMLVRNAHSLRLLALLCRILNYDKDVARRKRMNLDELNMLFGTNHKTWTDIERKILKPIKEDLDANSKISFVYEANFDKMGKGRPGFINVDIDAISKHAPQGKLF